MKIKNAQMGEVLKGVGKGVESAGKDVAETAAKETAKGLAQTTRESLESLVKNIGRGIAKTPEQLAKTTLKPGVRTLLKDTWKETYRQFPGFTKFVPKFFSNWAKLSVENRGIYKFLITSTADFNKVAGKQAGKISELLNTELNKIVSSTADEATKKALESYITKETPQVVLKKLASEDGTKTIINDITKVSQGLQLSLPGVAESGAVDASKIIDSTKLPQMFENIKSGITNIAEGDKEFAARLAPLSGIAGVTGTVAGTALQYTALGSTINYFWDRWQQSRRSLNEKITTLSNDVANFYNINLTSYFHDPVFGKNSVLITARLQKLNAQLMKYASAVSSLESIAQAILASDNDDTRYQISKKRISDLTNAIVNVKATVNSIKSVLNQTSIGMSDLLHLFDTNKSEILRDADDVINALEQFEQILNDGSSKIDKAYQQSKAETEAPKTEESQSGDMFYNFQQNGSMIYNFYRNDDKLINKTISNYIPVLKVIAGKKKLLNLHKHMSK